MPSKADASTCCGVDAIFERISSRIAGVVLSENMAEIIFSAASL